MITPFIHQEGTDNPCPKQKISTIKHYWILLRLCIQSFREWMGWSFFSFRFIFIQVTLFSSPCQKQCELLPSLQVHMLFLCGKWCCQMGSHRSVGKVRVPIYHNKYCHKIDSTFCVQNNFCLKNYVTTSKNI
jgi:hypothetical protein